MGLFDTQFFLYRSGSGYFSGDSLSVYLSLPQELIEMSEGILSARERVYRQARQRLP